MICEECNGSDFTSDDIRGEKVCNICGFVQEIIYELGDNKFSEEGIRDNSKQQQRMRLDQNYLDGDIPAILNLEKQRESNNKLQNKWKDNIHKFKRKILGAMGESKVKDWSDFITENPSFPEIEKSGKIEINSWISKNRGTPIDQEKFESEGSNWKKRWIYNDMTKWLIQSKVHTWLNYPLGFRSSDGEETTFSKIHFLFENKGQIKNDTQKVFEELSSHLPEKSLIDNQTHEPLTTPTRERSGIVFFVNKTSEETAFWFFNDFLKLASLNANNVKLIFDNNHPFSPLMGTTINNIYDFNNDKIIKSEILNLFTKRCAIYLGIKNLQGLDMDTVDLEFTNQIPDKLWNNLSMHKNTPCYWVPKNNKIFSNDFVRDGCRRPMQKRIIFSHIPIAYVVVQRFYDKYRGDPDWRYHCQRLLKLIENDLQWCEVTTKEMNAWWDETYMELNTTDSSKGSVTQLWK